MKKSARTLLPAVLLLLAGLALATTWSPEQIACPLCGKQITVQRIMSYGSYIYRWPEKYQLVFWPHTTGQALYFCPHCHLSAFMGDFEDIAKEKPDTKQKLVKLLAELKAAPRSKNATIPYRLGVAEAVYQLLGRDDAFWCHFYRVKGYHLAAAGQAEPARQARLEALKRAEKLLAAKLDLPPAKELLFVKGAMQYFSGSRDAARKTFATVLATPVPVSEKLPAERAQGYQKYLDELTRDFLDHMKKKEKIPGE